MGIKLGGGLTRGQHSLIPHSNAMMGPGFLSDTKGAIGLGSNAIIANTLLLKEGGSETLYLRNLSDTTYTDLYLRTLNSTTGIRLSSGSSIRTIASGGTYYYTLQSYDGSNWQEIAKAIGGYLEIARGKLTGDLDCGNKKLLNPDLSHILQVGDGSTDVNGDASITFSSEFSSTPKVFVSSQDASARGIVLDVVSVSTTGFTVKARQTTSLTTSSASNHQHVAFTKATGTSLSPTSYHKITSGDGTWSEGYLADATIGASRTCYTSAAGSHSHTVNASVLSIDFDWLAICL